MVEERDMSKTEKAELTEGGETTLHGHAADGAGPAEKGVATTNGEGMVTVNFSGSYDTKPIVSLTPEYSVSDGLVVAQIEEWIGAEPPYTGMIIVVGTIAGAPGMNVPVHWLIWP